LSGTIVIPTGDLARFTAFTVALATTDKPDGTMLSVYTSMSVTDNLNAMIAELGDDNEWVWILGDDHHWDRDCLLRLLDASEELDADMVVPLVCKRNPPWDLVIMKEQVEAEGPWPMWKPYGYSEIPDEPFEIAAAGCAGMLVRQRVLDALGEPWFISTEGSKVNEDVEFCRRAKELGFSLWCDPNVQMGHIGLFQVRPQKRDGKWGAMTQFSSEQEKYRTMWFDRSRLGAT